MCTDWLYLFNYQEGEKKVTNPGKNQKGQPCQIKNHHRGPVKIEYVEDPTARAKTFYTRKQNLLKKVSKLHSPNKGWLYVASSSAMSTSFV